MFVIVFIIILAVLVIWPKEFFMAVFYVLKKIAEGYRQARESK
jgi:hypothetical protein